MGERACSACGEVFPEAKLLLTGDGAICPGCEVEPTEGVESFEKRLHRKSATGALTMAVLSFVAVVTLPIALAFTVPVFFKLAASASKGGRANGDPVAVGITALASLVLASAVAFYYLR